MRTHDRNKRSCVPADVKVGSSGGLVLYASRCFSSADGCTYRPGEWTSAVKQDDLANGLVGILPDTDGKLYFFVGVQEYTLETYLGWTSKYSE